MILHRSSVENGERVPPFTDLWFRRILGRALSFSAGLAPAWAQTAAASESRIALVTLYPGSATVERVAKLAAGAKKFSFTCLPAGLDVKSLAVSADASVHLGELSVLREEREAVPACAGTVMDGRIRELEDKKAQLGAENDALGIVTGYLKAVSTPDTSGTGARVATDPKSIAAMADALRRTGQDVLTRQHLIGRQQEELDRALKPLLAERSRRVRRLRVGSYNNSRIYIRDPEYHS